MEKQCCHANEYKNHLFCYHMTIGKMLPLLRGDDINKSFTYAYSINLERLILMMK